RWVRHPHRAGRRWRQIVRVRGTARSKERAARPNLEAGVLGPFGDQETFRICRGGMSPGPSEEQKRRRNRSTAPRPQPTAPEAAMRLDLKHGGANACPPRL